MSAYEEIPGLRWSHLKELARSPLHYWHRLHVPRHDTAALRLGRAEHMAVLEPAAFAERFVVYREPKSKGTGSRTRWADFQLVHADKEILDVAEYDACLQMRTSARSHERAGALLEAIEQTEAVMRWARGERQCKRQCKARIDAWCSGGVLLEIKTCRDLAWFWKDAKSYLYHGQLAWYHDGIAALRSPPTAVKVIAIDKHVPHDIIVYDVPPATLAAGRALYTRLLARLDECERTNTWPGLDDGREATLVIDDDEKPAPIMIDGEEIVFED